MFAIPVIVDYSATLTQHWEIDQLEVVVFSASLRDYSAFEGIVGSLLHIPVMDRAAKGGYLTVDPIRFASENWVTSGVAKRAILQQTEEEAGNEKNRQYSLQSPLAGRGYCAGRNSQPQGVNP